MEMKVFKNFFTLIWNNKKGEKMIMDSNKRKEDEIEKKHNRKRNKGIRKIFI